MQAAGHGYTLPSAVSSAPPLGKETPFILAVDDDQTMLIIVETMLADRGYRVITATGGPAALELLDRHGGKLDCILLDRVMPDMDGIEVLGRIKTEPAFRHIPIIMQTGADRPEQIKEGIDAGVFYYLTKPFTGQVLNAVVDAALREGRQQRALRREMKNQAAGLGLLKDISFSCRTLEDIEHLSGFIANIFPDPPRALPGVAELLTNAVEHGNLDIGYDLKTRLITDGRWKQEIALRLRLPHYAERSASVSVIKSDKTVSMVVADAGAGFDWRPFMDTDIDPACAAGSHGRGILQAFKVSFDSLAYNDRGNEVTATCVIPASA